MSRRLFARFSVLLLTLLLTPLALAEGPPRAFWVFVGTYTGGNSTSQGIYRMELDPATGALSKPVLAASSASPSFLAIHPTRKTLYAVNELGEFGGLAQGSVSAFALDARTGTLTPINAQGSGGSYPCHLSVDRIGRNVLVANYGGGNVSVFPIRADGGLNPISSIQKHSGSGLDPKRQEAPHAHAVLLDPENRFALAADLGLDKVFISHFDSDRGLLTPNKPDSASLAPGSGPRHLAFSPQTGKHLYVINEMASTLTVFSFDDLKGSLGEIQTLSTLPSGFSGSNTTAEVQVHPSGKFVYGSNRGHDSLAIFQRDPDSGKLTPAGHQPSGGKAPRNFAIEPAGQFLLAANQDSGNVVVFRIDPDSGKLAPTGAKVSIPKPVCVEFVPIAP